MHVLVITSEWPDKHNPYSGVFVKRQVDLLRELGETVEVLSFRGHKNPSRYIKAVMDLYKCLRSKPVDVIHAHFGQAGLIAICQRRCPVVVTFHGSDLYGLAEKTILGKIYSLLLQNISFVVSKRVDRIILDSNRLAEKIKSKTYEVIPLGLNLSMFKSISKEQARKRLEWSMDEKVILFMGDPKSPIKRFQLALEAVSLIADKISSNVKLRVCYQESQEYVPFYLSASDVLVVTSAHEAGPLVVIEALACNLPVVSVDVGFVRQYVGSVDGCIVCKDDRADTIASALSMVLKRNERVHGRPVVQHLDDVSLIRRVIAVYKSVV